jgi:hypothetical protein
VGFCAKRDSGDRNFSQKTADRVDSLDYLENLLEVPWFRCRRGVGSTWYWIQAPPVHLTGASKLQLQSEQLLKLSRVPGSQEDPN